MKRPLYEVLWESLSRHKRMVFMAGPRQAGKTTLAKGIADRFSNRIYYNWDLITNKKLLLENPAFFEQMNRKDGSDPLVVLDEIHKYRKWKNYLKGIYDEYSNGYRFLVLGSGRLNVFQKGGDSLAGRYFLFTLWPLTLAELADSRRDFNDFLKNPLAMPAEKRQQPLWEQLGRLSGFPEPFLSGEETVYRNWSRTYHQQLMREDIRDLAGVKRVDEMEILHSLLPSRVGSPLSMDSLARDVQVSFTSVKNWLELFERFFLVLRLPPWTKKIARAIVKEKKIYLYDYASIESPAAKLENMAALELYRAVSGWNESGLGDFSLHYVRNKEKQEVDFLIARGRRPWLLIETKAGEEQASPSLIKIQSALGVDAVQLVAKPGVHRLVSNGNRKILIAHAARWLSGLP